MEDTEHVPREYPKTLYRGGAAYDQAGRGVHHSNIMVVGNAEEEAGARQEGFSPYGVAGAPEEPMNSLRQAIDYLEKSPPLDSPEPAETPPDPLDHDGDGKKGGSKKRP